MAGRRIFPMGTLSSARALCTVVCCCLLIACVSPNESKTMKQITSDPAGHILTNINVWSPDSRWIVYDRRTVGDVFDGRRIERVNVGTGEIQVLFESTNGACCGVATCSPVEDTVVFIHGPEHPTADWAYGASHRRGVLVDASAPGHGINLDARDLTVPLTPGALRGGTHVHVFSGDGQWVSFTYEDALLAEFTQEADGHEVNLRNVGVSIPAGAVVVGKDHPRNHDGAFFTVLVSRTVANPEWGSDQISRAFSDAWVGTDGYLRPDGTRQKRAIAFQGHVRAASGETLAEVFIADLPVEVTQPSDGPLEGTATTRPCPPLGVVQRRLTRTDARRHPGIQGPRHWLRSAPDGARIAVLMKDDTGVVQIWTVSPNGGPAIQVTRNTWDVSSAFSWSPNGCLLAYVMDNSVFVTDVGTGASHRLTPRVDDAAAPREHACCFSPDGTRVAFTRPVRTGGDVFDQIFVVSVPH